MFHELMHSLVGYELVKVLLTFRLSPKIWDDWESWSPDLFNLFSYLGDKQWDPSKKEHAEELLTILFDKTLHNGYFGKLSFGSKDKFAKITNTTLPLVMLTWLRQKNISTKLVTPMKVETGIHTESIVPLEPGM
jgi:hypothetical protein